MSLLTVTTVVCTDGLNPVELQAYLNNNPLAVISYIFCNGNVFYIIHV